jgi:hypothetical protein
MNTKLLLLTMIVFCLNSCTKDSNPVSNGPIPELLPLKIGNSWTMKRTLFYPPGTLWFIDTVTFNVISDTTIDNQTWYNTSYGTYRNGPDGLYTWYFGPLLTGKYPSFPYDTFSVQGRTITILSTNEPKKIGSNFLLCYHYSESIPSSNGFQLQTYFAPGIGWVHLEEASGIPTKTYAFQTIYDLIAYHLE